MKKFEEIKQQVVEAKDKTVTFCKEHKEGIKQAAIFALGATVSYILTKNHYTPRCTDGEWTSTDIVRFCDGEIGYVTKTYNKHNHERSGCRQAIGFTSPKVALKIGQDLIGLAKEDLEGTVNES